MNRGPIEYQTRLEEREGWNELSSIKLYEILIESEVPFDEILQSVQRGRIFVTKSGIHIRIKPE